VPDVFTKAKRSDVMSRIRSRGNADTELALVRVFRAHGITGWRRHLKLRVGELRVEGGKKSTSPRPSPQRGEGGARTRRVASQPSTFNSQLTVRPDFVFREVRLAVFVDGCFWHACPTHCRMPAGNRSFWRAKLARNQARDRLVTRTLRKAGWRVLRIWEHDLHRATRRRATKRRNRRRSTPHPGPLPGRGGEGAEARLVARLRRVLVK
jgi:DNA mismatch endonuclease (patch repair protein)